MRVLIVTDNEMVRIGLSVVLELVDEAEVIGKARNGQEAIDFCRTHTVDLALIDFEMPGMNGVDVARILRQQCRATRIILLTDLFEVGLRREALAAGATQLIYKSEPIDTLLTAIHAALPGSAAAGRPREARPQAQPRSRIL